MLLIAASTSISDPSRLGANVDAVLLSRIENTASIADIRVSSWRRSRKFRIFSLSGEKLDFDDAENRVEMGSEKSQKSSLNGQFVGEIASVAVFLLNMIRTEGRSQCSISSFAITVSPFGCQIVMLSGILKESLADALAAVPKRISAMDSRRNKREIELRNIAGIGSFRNWAEAENPACLMEGEPDSRGIFKSLHSLPLEASDLDSLNTGCISFRQSDGKNAIFERSLRFVGNDVDREEYGAREWTPVALLVVVVSIGDSLLVLSFAFYRNHVVVDRDIEILWLHAGYGRLNDNCLVCLINIDG